MLPSLLMDVWARDGEIEIVRAPPLLVTALGYSSTDDADITLHALTSMFSSTTTAAAIALSSRQCRKQLLRSFATAAESAEPTSSSSSQFSGSSSQHTSVDPQSSSGTRQRPKAQFNPSPRPSNQRLSSPSATINHLPPNFGQNQLLSVPDSTRALLESIVSEFNAPIRYAFAYGSGVFSQDGYADVAGKKGEDVPMLDFIFAVRHPGHWHSINMNQFPSHYPVHARALGSDFVSRVQDFGPGVWFNAYVPVNGMVCLHII